MPSKPKRNPHLARVVFFLFIIVTATAGTLLMFDLFCRMGLTRARLVFLVLFALLFTLLCIGFAHAFFGFLRRLFIRQSRIIHGTKLPEGPPATATAVVFPIYNEDISRVYAGVKATYRDWERQGENRGDVEFFILSDSTEPDNWVREEAGWVAMCQELRAFGKIFYRRREKNTNKKSGNLADFCRRWGGRYGYMIVMDADSILGGQALVTMIKLMDANPKAGLIQTAPRIARGGSIYGRLQQFASRLYGPVFQAGLDFWQGAAGNYWGHNAIIRLEPFIQYCDLPDLPGKEPFGGKILSHDFVEAALMVKAGWEVWLAHDIDCTYEEGPPSVIDSAKRDRRWMQGNLQHTWLLFSKGLNGCNRLHLLMGIMGYVVSPLWFLFLFLGTWITWQQRDSGLSMVEVLGFAGRWFDLTIREHGILVFAITMGMIFSMKILTFIDLALQRGRVRAFGGWIATFASVMVETILSTLLAPVFMLFHSKFILWLILGKSVTWGTQNRTADGTSWKEAVNAHAGHTLLGFLWCLCAWWIGTSGELPEDLSLFYWMLPVTCGMILSIPVSIVTSTAAGGRFFRKAGLFLTPEETQPPLVLQDLDTFAENARHPLPNQADLASHQGLTAAIIDPYVNAIHISLLPASGEDRILSPDESRLMEKIFGEGAESLSREESLRVLAEPQMLLSLHRRIWLQGLDQPADGWKQAILSYQKNRF